MPTYAADGESAYPVSTSLPLLYFIGVAISLQFTASDSATASGSWFILWCSASSSEKENKIFLHTCHRLNKLGKGSLVNDIYQLVRFVKIIYTTSLCKNANNVMANNKVFDTDSQSNI